MTREEDGGQEDYVQDIRSEVSSCSIERYINNTNITLTIINSAHCVHSNNNFPSSLVFKTPSQ